ncbi:o-succinylbenzoate--CoA ligase [Corynebacterium sp. sy017]|uniref:o-succinylbenzoate--CoA ligase n=1 Tax=unclassified Corynebacterium TaxID=2624378 RepID=UPI0011864F16|nr:o-succinylbenzoate--CoA ligase [Corynebacterium sp. SY003]MBP3089298.1 o-succinylbenzoate--CoA ligase [Corynebacterium sp. sy017]TSD91001.1 o-succinylbenzoate--CoA ligase [Corynebacterium sp. SY003]
MHRLEPLIIDPSPTGIDHALDVLETAIAGERSFAPLPHNDRNRAQLLQRTHRIGEPIDSDIALVMSTSGTTGTPKGALLSPTNLVASADATHQFLGGAGTWLLAMPAYHIAGMQVLIRSLVAGTNPVSIDVSTGFHVSDFAYAAAQLRAESTRCYTALTPLQLLKAMDTLQGIEALRLFDAILVGGAPLRAEDRRAAKELGITVISTYGSSETAGGCVYNGTPIPGAELKIVSERIYVAGPMVARGYRNSDQNADSFIDGWYASNDTGFLAQGILQVTGRIDTIINSGGLKIHPEVLEQRLAEVAGIESVCIVGIPDSKLGQAIAAAYTGSAAPTDIIEALDDLPRWQLPRHILKVEQLPLIGPGKVDRVGVEKLMTKMA